MSKSITLALYLATRARSDRAAKKVVEGASETETCFENERRGRTNAPQPLGGPLIWFHTGQDRQALAARELAMRMKSEREDLSFLLTTSADNRCPTEGCLVSQLVPDELLPSIRRFLDHWTPAVAVWTEPELRPALITEAAKRGVRLFLVDAHTAKPDTQAWRWLPGLSSSLLSRFERVLTGDAETAAMLKRLGAGPKQLEISGYLEEGTPALNCRESDRDALAGKLAARPVWLAAHVTIEECADVIDAHTRLQRRSHRLLLILVPDDLAEGVAWYERLANDGYRVALRSKGDDPGAETQIYIADTEGEMGLWYRLAPISFLGRSISADGGVNPYEPAALGSAIVHGPQVNNYRHAYGKLASAQAARLVRNRDELGDVVEQLLSPDTAASMAHNAWNVCSSGAEVTDRVRDLVFAELDEQEQS